MKNAYFTQLKSVKEQSFKDGTMAGIRLALNLVTIALSKGTDSASNGLRNWKRK